MQKLFFYQKALALLNALKLGKGFFSFALGVFMLFVGLVLCGILYRGLEAVFLIGYNFF